MPRKSSSNNNTPVKHTQNVPASEQSVKESPQSTHDISCNIECSCKCEENIQTLKAEFKKIIDSLAGSLCKGLSSVW